MNGINIPKETLGLVKLPPDIPANPNQTYKNEGWSGWGDLVGTGAIAPFFKKYRNFYSARKFAQGLQLKNRNEWTEYCHGLRQNLPHLPKDIPIAPWALYKNRGFNGMDDFLGNGNFRFGNWRKFKAARSFVRNLEL